MNTKSHRKRNIALLVILQSFVIITMIAQIVNGNYYNVFLCIFTLLLFNVPKIVGKKFNVTLPTFLEGMILFFIFGAGILGEIQSFYTIVPHWDVFLHLINGFIMASIGFALIDILNNHPKVHMNMSPYFVAFFAFCFSMTVGVIWEFFEFFMDIVMKYDMQKDFVLSSFSSVLINKKGINNPVRIGEITKTVITYGEGQKYVVDGYLDIGIVDTMKDLMVNFIGAVIFSIIGMFYIKRRGKGKIAKSLIPRMESEE